MKKNILGFCPIKAQKFKDSRNFLSEKNCIVMAMRWFMLSSLIVSGWELVTRITKKGLRGLRLSTARPLGKGEGSILVPPFDVT